jgi:hypothetical protein
MFAQEFELAFEMVENATSFACVADTIGPQ